tara:strand:- start:949 stop:1404 length:456 start_codon:yes stop_codon:yes gene_type:complete
MTRMFDKAATKPNVKRVAIHGIDQARLVCQFIRQKHFKEDYIIELWSAKNGSGSIGPAWFKGIINIISNDFPDLRVIGVLDCGKAAGHSLAALREGVDCIYTSTRPSVTKKIKMIADVAHIEVRTRRPKMPDLLEANKSEKILLKYLSKVL